MESKNKGGKMSLNLKKDKEKKDKGYEPEVTLATPFYIEQRSCLTFQIGFDYIKANGEKMIQ